VVRQDRRTKSAAAAGLTGAADADAEPAAARRKRQRKQGMARSRVPIFPGLVSCLDVELSTLGWE
jgi:hypothetical protein